MTHLLAIAVGPVQEFIAAARRTRDLWFGSRLLSEISRAVAAAVEEHGKLIFPASTKAPNVANVILAELSGDSDPASIAAKAKETAQKKWRTDYADPVSGEYQRCIRPDIWRDQVDDVIEFYAAWLPLVENYRDTRAKVMRLLAGRKNCHDFIKANGRAEVPKSSLDGLRESVLADPKSWHSRSCAQLRIREGEQLDVIGVVKRVAEGSKPYPSVSRVAADPWIRGHKDQLGPVIVECEHLAGNAVIRRLDVSQAGYPQYKTFPFEGSTVFLNRHRELIKEAGLDRDDLSSLAKAVARLGDPNPYLAVIVADGDKMGETISKLSNAEEHRAFSAALAEFAGEARDIVKEHYGVLVYSGGDDVLAFVPVDQCLDCARALHNRFGDLLKEWGEKAGSKITLSVGIAIGHFLENLEDLREYGRAAEKQAKQPDRDGLAVHLHKRGGGPIAVRGRWADDLDGRLKQFAKWLIDTKLPNRLAADLKQMADLYKEWQDDPAEAIRQDVLRVIRAKEPAGLAVLSEIEEELRSRVKDAASLRQLTEELLIARQIATACRQAAGPRKVKEQ